eukprot:12404220-Karenia_brevis.AAC.1
MVSLDLPKRSPDLNVLDYSLWHEIGKCMRSQESSMPKNTKESKDQFLKRLRRTALSLPSSVVQRAVMDMPRRLQCIEKAKGGHFIGG